MTERKSLTAAGLFAGIGGIELGLGDAGHRTSMLCEIDPHASRVLEAHFPDIPLESDVRDIRALPHGVDLVVAGFPCQDLSQAGRTAGINGGRSGLVSQVFRLIEGAEQRPRWLLLENVSFMLHLDRGEGMRYLTSELERMGMRWAYRVVDSRAFGLPQRRQRVILLASSVADPGPLLFEQEAGEPPEQEYEGKANGFYWTEGLRGLGWAVDAVPTLKGGSTIGIPSGPGIWMPDGRIVTPGIRAQERLQGFQSDWTLPGVLGERRQGPRWKMVGNAVSVPVARWIGERLALEPASAEYPASPLPEGAPWPRAAIGGPGMSRVAVDRSMWPVHAPRPHLVDVVRDDVTPLSVRACDGFLSRAARSGLNFPPGLLDAIRAHRARLANAAMALAS